MNTQETETTVLSFDLGSFEGFNFRDQSAICRTLSASDVVNWDHDREGEAEFWPAGDRPEMSLVFRSECVTGGELVELDQLLSDLGGDSQENWLRIYYALDVIGESLQSLTSQKLEDLNLSIYVGMSFGDLRKEAAYELFELYYPEEYTIWEKSHCDGLTFDEDRFLDSPCFSTIEVTLGDEKVLLVSPQ